ncbi:MAG: hypothetical protein QOJ52_2783, partial [Acidimicrobiaceae bacterium]|nr:hypothetical protein [Acidimicrobiaceae bacterium]
FPWRHPSGWTPSPTSTTSSGPSQNLNERVRERHSRSLRLRSRRSGCPQELHGSGPRSETRWPRTGYKRRRGSNLRGRPPRLLPLPRLPGPRLLAPERDARLVPLLRPAPQLSLVPWRERPLPPRPLPPRPLPPRPLPPRPLPPVWRRAGPRPLPLPPRLQPPVWRRARPHLAPRLRRRPDPAPPHRRLVLPAGARSSRCRSRISPFQSRITTICAWRKSSRSCRNSTTRSWWRCSCTNKPEPTAPPSSIGSMPFWRATNSPLAIARISVAAPDSLMRCDASRLTTPTARQHRDGSIPCRVVDRCASTRACGRPPNWSRWLRRSHRLPKLPTQHDHVVQTYQSTTTVTTTAIAARATVEATQK